MLISKMSHSADEIVRATCSSALGLLLKSTNLLQWRASGLDRADSARERPWFRVYWKPVVVHNDKCKKLLLPFEVWIGSHLGLSRIWLGHPGNKMIEVDHVGLWTEVSHFLMGASKLDMIFCICFSLFFVSSARCTVACVCGGEWVSYLRGIYL